MRPLTRWAAPVEVAPTQNVTTSLPLTRPLAM
jgi:hypothetical protein